ncbi:MAG: DUF2541 domain-containing protein [Pseudomonadota bacterium]
MYQRGLTAFIVATLSASWATTSWPVLAQPADERLYRLRIVRIDDRQAVARVDLSSTPGAVRGLRLRSRRGKLRIRNIRIVYADGNVFTEKRTIELDEGSRTRVIDPQSDDRFVDKLELSLSPRRRRGLPPVIEVLAHQTPSGRNRARPTAPAPPRSADAPAPGNAPQSVTLSTASQPSASDRPTAPDRPTAIAIPMRKADILDAVAAQDNEDVLVGAKRVHLNAAEGAITLDNQIGKFRSLRLRILESDMLIKAVTIVDAFGGRDTRELNATIKQGQLTPWVTFRRPQFLSQIQVRYAAQTASTKRARIEVIGAFADGWLGPNGEGQRFNDGWVLLGAQTAGFVGFDSDAIAVGRSKGQFRQLRVRVRDRTITLRQLRIIYDDGSSDIVPVRSRIGPRETWGPITLAKKPKPIAAIRARYRSMFFDRQAADAGAAIVELWGRY